MNLNKLENKSETSSLHPIRGKFISFEGIDGAGKSTHLEFFKAQLEASGKTIVQTREPGGTVLGEVLRSLILKNKMALETETLLISAARFEHMTQLIEPALKRGDWVLSDRFSDATFAYQCGGKGLSIEKMKSLMHWVQGDFLPDLTVIFDAPIEVANGRRNKRVKGMERESKEIKQQTYVTDRFENESDHFFERVRQAYLLLATENTARYKVIDSTQTIPQIQQNLINLIKHF